MGALSGDAFLDELEFLADVEHALIVDNLTIHAALGHDLDAAGPDPLGERVRDAAQAAFNIAIGEMNHLRRATTALAAAGRRPSVNRAGTIAVASGAEVTLSTPDAAELRRLVERGRAIATAVDARWAELCDAVVSQEPPVAADALEQVRFALEPCIAHSDSPAAIGEHLDGLEAEQFLRGTRRDPGDDVERALLRVGDAHYALVVALVRAWLGHDELAGELRGRAIDAMGTLNEFNRTLAERGLLPAFTLPPG